MNDSTLTATAPPPVRARAAARPTARAVGGYAALVAAAALAVILALDGSVLWRVARPALALAVGALTANSIRRGQGRVPSLVALLAGATALPAGIVFAIAHGQESGLTALTAAGTALLLAALALVAVGTLLLVRRRRGWRRVLLLPPVVTVLALVGYPLFGAIYATNVPRPQLGATTPADLGFAYEDATFATADGVRLSGWYLPSRNGAAVVLLHGASSTRSNVLTHATVLAEHGYGVLLFDARGHGRSEGRAMAFGWYGDLDTSAAVSFVAAQPDVDPTRIAGIGLSMGGEQVIGAAADDPRLAAVVAEGATNRNAADKDGWLPRGPNGWLQRRIDWLTYTLTDVLTDARPPVPLRDAIAIARRPSLLIAGHGEEDAARYFAGGSPATVEVWEVDAGHTDALAVYPDQWTQRVIGFLDTALDVDPNR